MEPKKFKEANALFGGKIFLDLPVLLADLPLGGKEAVTCWNLSFKERLKILLKGEIWVSLSIKNELPPMFITTKKSDIIIKQNKNSQVAEGQLY